MSLKWFAALARMTAQLPRRGLKLELGEQQTDSTGWQRPVTLPKTSRSFKGEFTPLKSFVAAERTEGFRLLGPVREPLHRPPFKSLG